MTNEPNELKRWPGKTVEEIQDAYDEEMIEKYNRIEPIYRLWTKRFRRRLFSEADGHVLDVACGPGVNFSHFSDSANIVAVDINPELLEIARDEAAEVKNPVQLETMDAQNLAFDDDSFDNVVSSFSTCTFPDPVEALNEMGRVCKSNGEIRLLEHGRSDIRPYAWLQDRKADSEYNRNGCRLYDDPTEIIKQANLDIKSETKQWFGVYTEVVSRPSTGSMV